MYIELGRSYTEKNPTAQPIHENARVRGYADLLSGELNESTLGRLGQMMYQSHQSYSACGLGSWGTDNIVNMVRSSEPACGLYGAKITGGGSGGTVAVLGRSNAGDQIQEIANTYESETGYRPYIFHGSSPGAARFGYLR